MSYLNYVVAAYACFVIVLAWDFIATHLHIRRELRAARLRAARQAAAPVSSPQASSELIR